MASAHLVEKAKARIGMVLRDKWRLDTLLGVGGSASVYAATHRNGKRAALKLLHPELAAEKDFVDRFLREGYVANKIDHPAAVQIQDDDVTEDGYAYLVMELLEGYTLERRLRKKVAVPITEALKITEDLLDVIAIAHEKGVIHRDIKPANIFVTKQKVVKVLDFGIARLIEPQGGLQPGATQMGMPLGTPAFMPPEQARGRWDEVDERTDLWAVGATLYALILGDRPRRAPTANEELLLAMTQPLPPLAELAPGTNPEVCKLVDRAVAVDMKARWPNARTMQQALRLASLLVQAAGTPEGEEAAVSMAALYDPPTVTPTGPDGEPLADGNETTSATTGDEHGVTTARAITKASDDLVGDEPSGGKGKWLLLLLAAAIAVAAFVYRGKIQQMIHPPPPVNATPAVTTPPPPPPPAEVTTPATSASAIPSASGSAPPVDLDTLGSATPQTNAYGKPIGSASAAPSASAAKSAKHAGAKPAAPKSPVLSPSHSSTTPPPTEPSPDNE
ncbi:MAG: serine/threonine-protein kinase [Polyangiaceae bacterium]